MELIIKQSQLKKNFQYKIYALDELIYTAQANRIIIPRFRNITLFNHKGEIVCSFKQNEWKKFILSKIPIISLFRFSICPFSYYKGGIEKGYTKGKVEGGYIFGAIDGISYEIWEETSEYTGIFREGKQVALITRSRFKQFDGDQYKLIYSKSLEMEIAAMLCLLVDTLWYTKDSQIYSTSWEYTIYYGGKKVDKDWVPED